MKAIVYRLYGCPEVLEYAAYTSNQPVDTNLGDHLFTNFCTTPLS